MSHNMQTVEKDPVSRAATQILEGPVLQLLCCSVWKKMYDCDSD